MTSPGAIARALAAQGLPSSLRLPSEPVSDEQWPILAMVLQGQRLPGLLTAAVAAGQLAVTEEQYDDVRSLQRDAAAKQLRIERLLLDVDLLLRDQGIPYRVIKGPSTARTLYAEPWQRQFGDLDLVFRSTDIDRAIATLCREMGAERPVGALRPDFDRRFGKGAELHLPDGREIDVHRTFVAGPLGLGLPLADFFAASDSFELGGRALPCLDAPHRFLLSCFGTLTARPRLPNLRDVAWSVVHGGLDLEQVDRLASRYGLTSVVDWGVRQAWEQLGIEATDPWVDASCRRPLDERALGPYIGADQSYAVRAMAASRAIPTIRAKAAYLRAIALPDRAHLGSRDTTRIGHLARGLWHAVRRHGRDLQ
jgi:hypothetical protein